ncbi:MAG TPA: hypothetical protein IAB92_02965 [Candidatus Faecousia faecigallinarum]|nr:hypothetical protein [Candidatus Faecousia faecigallinarum]
MAGASPLLTAPATAQPGKVSPEMRELAAFTSASPKTIQILFKNFWKTLAKILGLR